MTANIYLTFDGNCKKAFDFYKSVFGGEFTTISPFSDMPPSESFTLPESDKDRLMHVTLPIGKETVIMGSDTISGYGLPLVAGTNFSISINTGNRIEADRVFNALSDGGQVTMPMQVTFWESYFGTCTDKFGIQWMISAPAK
jgi:PhnB protein